MDWQQALELIVARAGHARYRDLCDESHPDHTIWRARMIERATGEPAPPAATIAAPPRPDLAEAVGLVRRMNGCPFRSTEGCGCSGGKCALRGGAIVSHIDCFACVRTYG